MTNPLHWSILIQWSDEDGAYLVTLPEWEGCVVNPVTHGQSYEEAVRRGQEVLEMLVELYEEQGRSLPAPRGAVAAV